MATDSQIPEPFLFNPLKHHLGFIKEFVRSNIDSLQSDITRLSTDLKHLGTSVTDVYNGSLPTERICRELNESMIKSGTYSFESYFQWIGENPENFHITVLSDKSLWTLKYHNNTNRFIHFFPARSSPHTFRVKANTIKSAVLYNIMIGKDMVTGQDLNRIRPLLGLSPIKDSADIEAIHELIEIIRS